MRSLFGQTLDDIEYIFVDDCTNDNGISVLERILKEYPCRADWVKVIHLEKNSGVANARTVGMKSAIGEYMIRFKCLLYSIPYRYVLVGIFIFF